jgi:hypothetical protein
VSQPTEPSTSGPRPLRLRTGHSPPDNQSGLNQSATGYDRKQAKSKTIEHTKREWKNGAGNTSHEKEKETSLKKDRSYWKAKINDGTIHPYSMDTTNPEKGRELMKTTRSCPTKKDQSRQHTHQTGSSGRGKEEN